jgi:S-adenosylmethionine-diacylglycerol 3-amino-3-carboxypropyl transferase
MTAKPAPPLPGWVSAAARRPLRFAQVREDAALDAAVVRALPDGARVAMVGSGGCTLAHLVQEPRLARIVAVDPNPAQIALCRLKLALAALAPASRLAPLGHAPCAPERRARELERLCSSAGVEPAALGDADELARLGPDHMGRYEAVFAELRRGLAPIAEALAARLERAERTPLDARAVSVLDDAFAAAMALPILVRLFGEDATRNPARPFARHFAERTRAALESPLAFENPYLASVLLGRFPGAAVPPWLSEPPPARAPETILRAETMQAHLASVSEEYDLVHLSNILDWLSPEDARSALAGAHRALRPGGRVLIRQLNSVLNIPESFDGFAWEPDAERLHRGDRSYFYARLHLGRKR